MCLSRFEIRDDASHRRDGPALEFEQKLSLPARAALLLVQAYRLGLSPFLAPRCRFMPSCSSYAAEALRRHGFLRGGALAARRVLRCHPWGGSGYDPVP